MATTSNNTKPPKVIKFKCKVTILAGRNLAAKDRVAFGLFGRSDPYVEVYANNKFIGKTPVKKVTLDPVWESDNVFEMTMEEGYHLPPPKLDLKIWDEDFGKDPDAMGTVTLIVPARTEERCEWYPVPPHSAKSAKGDLQVKLETQRFKKREKRGKKATGRDGLSKSPARRKRSKSPTKSRGKSPKNKSKSNAEATRKTSSKSPNRHRSEPVHAAVSERSTRRESPKRSKSPKQPRRSMNTPIELPERKIHECNVIMNESSYWDQRVEELGWEIEDLHGRINNTTVFKPTDNLKRNSILPIVEHLQEEVKRRTVEREQRLNKKFKDQFTQMQVKVTVIQGIGLAAKNQDEYGRLVSSNPYVEVWKDRNILGKTATQQQTLDPIWNEQFVLMVDKERIPKIALRLWDEDEDDEPDCLGTVTLKLGPEETDILEWYEVPYTSTKGKDAEGVVQVHIESTMAIDQKQYAEKLQKQVDELEQQLKATLIASDEKADAGQNTLQPTMQFLKNRNKELILEEMEGAKH